MALALFDFDGTITFRDSFAGFIKYMIGPVRFYLGVACLIPVVAAFLLGFIRASRAKELMAVYFFRGRDAEEFRALARRYSLDELPNIVRSEALERISWHKARGDTVIVVSASIDLWLQGWCEASGVGLIATELEIVEGRISGRFLTRNCTGREKVKRIEASVNLSGFDYIYAYGDSPGDNAMLALAREGWYRGKPFRT